MKRSLALILALVIVLSVSSVAYAVNSPAAAPVVETGTKAAALPTVVSGDAQLTPVDKIADLPEEAQAELKEANSALKEAVPDGMVARYVVYAESKTVPYELTLKMEDIKDIKDFASKIFKDGKWVELKAVLNADGTVTITVTDNGPLAVFTKK